MNDLKVDYFQASFTTNGNNSELLINDNGDIMDKNLNEDDILRLVTIINSPNEDDNDNLLKKLKNEFPIKEEKSKTRKRKNNSKKSRKQNKKSKKTKRNNLDSIDSVFN